MCGLLASLGSAAADAAMSQEVAIERSFWSDIPVRDVAVMNDCDPTSKNARADPITRDIYLGYYMFHTLVNQFGNSLPAAGVLAHEWGHQVQFAFRWYSDPVRPMELEADAFSGYYMALRKGWAWSYMSSYFQAVYSFGDTNFNAPDHHGTPQERLAMARVGFDTAVHASTMGRPFSYFELHEIFYQAISSLRFSAVSAQISDPLIEAVAEHVSSGEARDIAAGRSEGSNDRIPGSDSDRRLLGPRR